MEEESKKKLIDGIVGSHSFLTDAVGIVGAEALADINSAVGDVRPASNMFVNPLFGPSKILD